MFGITLRGGVGTLAVGAFVALNANSASAEVPKTPTFSKDIAPIFQAKCQNCHEPGSIAPMSLRTFQEARPWARSIKSRDVYKRQAFL